MLLKRPPVWKLFVFPLISVILVVFGLYWGKDTILLTQHGKKSKANVNGMLKIFEKKADFITGVNYQIQITFANNKTAAAIINKGETIYITYNGTNFDKSSLISINESIPDHPIGFLLSLSQKIVATDISGIERIVKQSQIKNEHEKIVSIKVSETINVFENLALPIKSILSHNKEVISVQTATGTFDTSTLVPRVVTVLFTQLDKVTDAEKIDLLKRDVAISMTKKIDSAITVLDHTKNNFIFHEKSYRYIFRPVYNYVVNGIEYTIPSKFAKRHSPSDDLEVGDLITIAYDSRDPARSTIPPSAGGLGKESNILDRFNAATGTLLGRWFIPGLLFIFGIVFGTTGIILVSLYISPGEDKGSSADVID